MAQKGDDEELETNVLTLWASPHFSHGGRRLQKLALGGWFYFVISILANIALHRNYGSEPASLLQLLHSLDKKVNAKRVTLIFDGRNSLSRYPFLLQKTDYFRPSLHLKIESDELNGIVTKLKCKKDRKAVYCYHICTAVTAWIRLSLPWRAWNSVKASMSWRAEHFLLHRPSDNPVKMASWVTDTLLMRCSSWMRPCSYPSMAGEAATSCEPV